MDINNPLDAIYAYAEQAYIRQQAGDLLMRCLDLGSPRPMQELVEGLILAGSHSVGTLHEILVETGQRRAQVQDDLQRVYGEFQNKLKKNGLKVGEVFQDAISLTRITPALFYRLMAEHGIQDEMIRIECYRSFEETQDLMTSLYGNIKLLQEIENYLRDWLWGLAYQSAHETQPAFRSSPVNWAL
jgi:hypothetical protein